MICADFLAGANLENGNPEVLLQSISRYFKFLPVPQRQVFLAQLNQKASEPNLSEASLPSARSRIIQAAVPTSLSARRMEMSVLWRYEPASSSSQRISQ